MPINSSSNAPLGYHGQYLRVDVSDGSRNSIPIETNVLRRYLGGVGLGTWIALREGAATVDAFAPNSTLAFVFSPLVGSPLTTSAKFAVVSRSPLTERINDSLASSQFAIAGKRTGFDAIAVTGKALAPSLLVIDGDSVRLDSADGLWGQTIFETERQLRQRYGPEFSAAVIGPAGEQRVRYATISHDGRHAGRGGSGAVLGAKNIKAVLVRGDRRCVWASPRALAKYAKQLSAKSFGPATAKYRELGTASNLLAFNRLHALPTRNFSRGSFDQVDQLSPEVLAETREHTRKSCAACTIGCEHLYERKEKGLAASQVRLEYESLFALGSLCGIADSDMVLAATSRCDELGIDTISLGGTVAFAMECVEHSLLDVDWLRFGSGEALLRCIDLVARREGLGGDLAEGSRRLAEKIGHDSIQFAPQVKGLEIPGYEPRSVQTLALGMAVSTRGADHNRSSAYEVDFSDRADRRNLNSASATLAIESEDRAALMDSLILCKFLRGVFTDFFADAGEILSLVTGWDFSAQEALATAKRIVDARKWFNIQAGWTPAEDTLPERFLGEPLSDDAEARLTREQLDQAIVAYNRGRNWTDDGFLTGGFNL